MYTKPDTPLSIGGVLDDGFKLTRATYKHVFGIALLGAFASNIPSMMITPNAEDPLAIFGPGLILATIIGSLFGLFVFAWAVHRVHSISEGREISLGEAAPHAASNYLTLLVVMICYVLIVVLGLFAFVIPGIILGLTLLLAPYLVVIDNQGFVDALKQSHNLVWGNWWRTAVIFTVIFFILTVLYLVITVVVALVIGFQAAETESSMLLNLLNWVIVPVITATYMPVMYACTVAIFNDLKLRKEGGDLDARLAEAETAVE